MKTSSSTVFLLSKTMMDLIKTAECLSCVAAVALTLFVIMFQGNISSENWFVSKKKMMWATSPFALISFSLGACLTFLVNMEMKSSTTPSAPIQRPNMKFVEADAVLSARFTLLCAYITFLMGLVTLKTGWSSGLRKKIHLSIPFFTSVFAMNLLFLQALWQWICNAQTGPHSPTNWVYYCILASWFFALADVGPELQLQRLAQLGKEVAIFHQELGTILGKRKVEDARKHLALLECELSTFRPDSWNNQMSPVLVEIEQV